MTRPTRAGSETAPLRPTFVPTRDRARVRARPPRQPTHVRRRARCTKMLRAPSPSSNTGQPGVTNSRN